MAATVLNGLGSLTGYTNNTGGNVRVIIYYMSSATVGGQQQISVVSSFGTASASNSSGSFSIGKDLAGTTAATTTVNSTAQNVGGNGFGTVQIPTQIMLADGQSLSATCGGYNIAIIPENG